MPTLFAPPLFDARFEAEKKVGMRLIGMQAVNSLRPETGGRHGESDITPDETPYEAGLGFGSSWTKAILSDGLRYWSKREKVSNENR